MCFLGGLITLADCKFHSGNRTCKLNIQTTNPRLKLASNTCIPLHHEPVISQRVTSNIKLSQSQDSDRPWFGSNWTVSSKCGSCGQQCLALFVLSFLAAWPFCADPPERFVASATACISSLLPSTWLQILQDSENKNKLQSFASHKK